MSARASERARHDPRWRFARRIEIHASYWTTVFPAMAVMAAGMSLAVAPLTSSVLGSVDEKHVGTASGFNSAVARTGGLIATAMLGAALSRGAKR